MVQKKAKGSGGEVGQQAEGGEKRCSSAFSSAFVFKREPNARLTRITFFGHVFFESGRGRRQKTFRSSRHLKGRGGRQKTFRSLRHLSFLKA